MRLLSLNLAHFWPKVAATSTRARWIQITWTPMITDLEFPAHEYCRQCRINLAKLSQSFHSLREAGPISKALRRFKVKGVRTPGLSQQIETQHERSQIVLYGKGDIALWVRL